MSDTNTDDDSTDITDNAIDVPFVRTLQTGELQINAGPLYVEFASGETGGIKIIQHGDFLALSQGIDYADGDRATVGHDLTADDARDLAEALLDAADRVEEAQSNDDIATVDDDERDTLLQRAIQEVLR